MHDINHIIKSGHVEFRNVNTEDDLSNSLIMPINSSVAGPHLESISLPISPVSLRPVSARRLST
jgi:hypothetical protein